MKKSAKTLLLAGAALASLPVCHVQSAEPPYPVKPVRLVIPYAPGGDEYRQQFIADNRSGAGGTVGIDIAVKAPADGYTLLMMNSALAYIAYPGAVTNGALRHPERPRHYQSNRRHAQRAGGEPRRAGEIRQGTDRADESKTRPVELWRGRRRHAASRDGVVRGHGRCEGQARHRLLLRAQCSSVQARHPQPR